MFSPWEVLLYMLIYWIQPKTMPDSSCIMWVYRMRQTAHKKWAPLSHHSPCSHEGALPAHFVVVQLLSHVWLFATLWTAASQASLSFTVSKSLLKFMPIELVMLSNHLILCHPLFAFNLSQHQGHFQWIGSLYQVAKVLELQLQHQSFQWTFRVDFL